MNRNFKSIIILLIILIITVQAVRHLFFPYKPLHLIEDIMATSFAGEVESIDTGKDFKVKLKGDSNLYSLRGTCNDSVCLTNVIQFGDSLSKNASDSIITLKRKGQNPMLFWIQ